MRGSRDKTRTIERKLGFFTENGLRRVHNAYLHPSLKKMLSGMDEIKKEYVEVAIDEIRTSQSFARAWHNLFDDIGPSLWPTATSFDAGPMQDPELYPRRLEYHNIHDRVLLEEYFFELIMQKCLTYQRNRADKSRREERARKDSQFEEPRSSVTHYEVPTPNMVQDHHSSTAYAAKLRLSSLYEPSEDLESDSTDDDRDVQIIETKDEQRGSFGRPRTTTTGPRRGPDAADMKAFYNRIHTTKRLRPSHERRDQIPRKRPCQQDERAKANAQLMRDQRYGNGSLEESSASDNSDSESVFSRQQLLVKLKVPSSRLIQLVEAMRKRTSTSTVESLAQSATASLAPDTTLGSASKPCSRFTASVESVPEDAPLEDGGATWIFARPASACQASQRSRTAVVPDNQSNPDLVQPQSASTSPSFPSPPVGPRRRHVPGSASTRDEQKEHISEQNNAFRSTKPAERTDLVTHEPQLTDNPRVEQRLSDSAGRPNDATMFQGALQSTDRGLEEREPLSLNSQSQTEISNDTESPVESHDTVQGSKSELCDQATATSAAEPAQTLEDPADQTISTMARTAGEALALSNDFAREKTVPTESDLRPESLEPTQSSASKRDPSPAAIASTLLPTSGHTGHTSQQPAPATQSTIMMLVDWKHSNDNITPPLTRILRFRPELWKTVKADMPTAFVGKRLLSLVRTTVSMSAAEVMQQYGEGIGDVIADEALEECAEFLVDRAFSEDAEVPMEWKKVTVTMRD